MRLKTGYKFSLFILFYFFIIFRFGAENSDLLTVFLSLSLMIPIVYLINDSYKQKNEISRLQEETLTAELNLLKSQINPHFFFNTLNNLYGLAVEKSDQTEQVIYKLSEMMRFTIYDGRKDTVTVKEEINYLTNFLELNKLRYKSAIDVTFDKSIEDDLQRIPPLLFINLLENAFKHGAETVLDSAYIKFRLITNSKLISFDIENNYEYENKKKTIGMGVSNLKRRLDLLFPNKHVYETTEEEQIYTAKVEIDLT